MSTAANYHASNAFPCLINVPEHPGPPRVLIADDDRNIRFALHACLETEGYEIAEAGDGREVIDAVIHDSPDVLLLDLAMPHVDGLTVLRELATTYRGLKPRIVILTAWGSVSAAEQADRYGASAFLEKPLDPESLRSIIARVLAERRDHANRDEEDRPGSEHYFG